MTRASHANALKTKFNWINFENLALSVIIIDSLIIHFVKQCNSIKMYFISFPGVTVISYNKCLILGLNFQQCTFNSSLTFSLYVVPSAMMAILKIFRDHKLLFRVRSAVKNAANPTPELSFNFKVLEKQSFMLSMYAKTLRLFVQVFVTRCSPHTVVHINNWLLSRNKISMMSSHPAHMNVEVWNIKGGVHFFDKFWAERFLIDFNDSENDPIKMNVIDHKSIDNRKIDLQRGRSAIFSQRLKRLVNSLRKWIFILFTSCTYDGRLCRRTFDLSTTDFCHQND